MNDGEMQSTERNKAIPWVFGVVLLAAAGAAWYFWQQRQPPAPQPEPVAAAPAAATPLPPVAPEIHYPVAEVPEAQAEAKPLPELNDSDHTAAEALSLVIGLDALKKFVVTQELVRHIVVTVDNLPRKSVALRLNPVRPVGGEFRVTGGEGSFAIAPENAARYEPYVRIVQLVNAKKLTLAYGRLYPLFQKAYEDLGYPKAYFNDRLIVVIDHLLGAPEVQGPIPVVAPHVQYQFADPELEALSAGQKVLLRMGSANAAVIKAKLREIRAELTGAGAGIAAKN